MPVTGAMDVVVSRLNVEVAAVPDDLRRVVVKVRRVVEHRLTVTVAGSVRALTEPELRRHGRAVGLADLSVTASNAISVLSLGFTTKGKREGGGESDGGQQHFLIQHG